MNTSKKLSIGFAQEERFEASINIVRQLSEGKLTRDPGIIRPLPIRPNPPQRILNPRVRSFQPTSEWMARITGYSARGNKTLAAIRAEQALKRKLRRQKAKVAA